MVSRFRSNIRLSDALDRYIERIRNAGHAEKSVYTASAVLHRFQRKLAESRRDPDPYVHMISESTVDDYFFGPTGIRRTGKLKSAAGFNRYRSVLKMFFDYAVVMHWADINPVLAIDPARPDPPRSRLLLSASELLALPDYAGNPVERMAVAIGENTGLRANDIAHLTVFDVNLANGTLQTEIRKTRKMDDKPISVELRTELNRWFAEYRQVMGVDELEDDWLLLPAYRVAPPRAGKRLLIADPRKVISHPERLVQRPLARMGYPTKQEGFHTLRRSAARVFFDSLRDKGEARDHALMIVKEFLNHSSVVQTEHYLGLNFDRTARDELLRDRSFLTAAAEQEQARISGTTVEHLGERRGA